MGLEAALALLERRLGLASQLQESWRLGWKFSLARTHDKSGLGRVFGPGSENGALVSHHVMAGRSIQVFVAVGGGGGTGESVVRGEGLP